MSTAVPRPLTAVASRKRKERDPPAAPRSAAVTEQDPGSSSAAAEAARPTGNRLLAGYLAQEFLTKGTLFGQTFEPGRAARPPKSNSGAGPAEPGPGKPYAEVALLVKADGVHVPGVVNPAQLGHWLQKWSDADAPRGN